mgnify:CR=1 FL=1
MIKGFKDFILRGNLVDLAVAVVIGTAFGVLVKSMTYNLITPVLAMIGGILTGLGLAVGVAEPGSFAPVAVTGVTGAILHWLAFGPDPMTDKGMEGVDAFQQDRAARMVEAAEAIWLPRSLISVWVSGVPRPRMK